MTNNKQYVIIRRALKGTQLLYQEEIMGKKKVSSPESKRTFFVSPRGVTRVKFDRLFVVSPEGEVTEKKNIDLSPRNFLPETESN